MEEFWISETKRTSISKYKIKPMLNRVLHTKGTDHYEIVPQKQLPKFWNALVKQVNSDPIISVKQMFCHKPNISGGTTCTDREFSWWMAFRKTTLVYSGDHTKLILLTGYCYGVVLYKASHTLRPFYDLLCVSIWVLTIPDSSTRALWQIPAQTPGSEAGRNLERNYF
jgi:hypothetical protein